MPSRDGGDGFVVIDRLLGRNYMSDKTFFLVTTVLSAVGFVCGMVSLLIGVYSL